MPPRAEGSAVRHARQIVGLSFALVSGLACTCDEGPAGERSEAPSSTETAGPPIVSTDGGTPLIFTWVDEDGRFHVAHEREEIPEKRRGVVRVQDPNNPPPDSTKVWVADLRSPTKGRFAVRQLGRDEFEALAARHRPAASLTDAAPPQGDGGASGEAPRVVMYMTSTCPVCRRARSWLAEQGVSFVERNIGRDPAAARELQEKARRQGVPADGVPVFEIGGRLIPGFDQGRLRQALGR